MWFAGERIPGGHHHRRDRPVGVEARLPPRGVLPIGIADTLQLACDVVVNRSEVALDSVRVRFASSADSAPVTTIRVVLP